MVDGILHLDFPIFGRMEEPMIKLLFSMIAFGLSLSLLAGQTIAQCSDAGVCAIGGTPSPLRHQLSLNYVFGKSGKEDDLTFHSLRLEGDVEILEQSRLYLSLPFSRQMGPIGTTAGIGDLTIMWHQRVFRNHHSALDLQGGLKLKTGTVNERNLPQAYQSGLGTNDLLLGATYSIENFSFSTGYQIVTGRSANRVDRLKRGDDLLVRAAYTHKAHPLRADAEVLAIKRIQESNVLDPENPRSTSFVDLPNSNQLQINLLGRLTYALSESHALQTTIAVPLRNRKINVDGLTRSFTLSLGLAYLF